MKEAPGFHIYPKTGIWNTLGVPKWATHRMKAWAPFLEGSPLLDKKALRGDRDTQTVPIYMYL